MLLRQHPNVATAIVDTLMEHAAFIYKGLPSKKEVKNKVDTQTRLFFEKLPKHFTTAEAKQKWIETGGICVKTATRRIDDFIRQGIVQKTAHAQYQKIITK